MTRATRSVSDSTQETPHRGLENALERGAARAGEEVDDVVLEGGGGDVELEGGGELLETGLGEGGEGLALVHSHSDLPFAA